MRTYSLAIANYRVKMDEKFMDFFKALRALSCRNTELRALMFPAEDTTHVPTWSKSFMTFIYLWQQLPPSLQYSVLTLILVLSIYINV